MNERLKRWLDFTKKFLARLSTPKKILLAIGVSTIVTGLLAAIYAIGQDPYETLYSELQPEESKAVSKKLSEMNIPFQLSNDYTAISTPKSQVALARMQLAKEGLPGQDVVGFEKFDSSTLGMSSYVQRIQYVRAVQGELTRSIQRLASVKRARVHISIPPKKTFLEEQDPPKASVVLELKSGQHPSKAEINGVAHLVASAVEGLSVKHVTIVNTKGDFLHHPEEAGVAFSNTLIEIQRTLESDYEKRVEELLVPVVGVDKINAKVTVEIDPAQSNVTEETFDPEHSVARQVAKNDEVSRGSRPNPLGIPGSRSNLPGAEVQNPPVPTSNFTNEKNTENSSYLVPRKVQVVTKPSGGIKRLTVSVVVDGHYSKGPDGKGPETFIPRTEDELKRLQEIVANAVGFDSQRRDSITVSCLPFKNLEIAQDTLPQPGLNWSEIIRQGMKNGLLLAVILIFFFTVLRPFLRWATTEDIEKDMALFPKTLEEFQASRDKEGIFPISKSILSIEEGEPLEKQEETELLKRVQEKLYGAPKKGVRVIQDWIETEQPQSLPVVDTTEVAT